MAFVWVKLKTMKSISFNGTTRTYYPGDWVEIGKHDARQWVEDGTAEILRADVKTQTFDFAECGVVVTNGEYNPLKASSLDIDVSKAPPLLQYPKTMIYDATFERINHELIPVGFKMLDQRKDSDAIPWQIAVPLHSYRELACDIGTDHDKKITQEIVHDLRCMVFEPRFMFVRRCPDMEQLMVFWQEEKNRGQNEKLAFLRAVYRVKPLILHLPVTWIGVKW